MKTSFVEKLGAAIERNGSLLCVGLDPDLGKLAGFLPTSPLEERLVRWTMGIVEQTADLVCCYKPNIAFYEQYGAEGLSALRRSIAAIPGDIPVLLDAKRGDIDSTAAAYARAAFELLGADAITISPYLGRDSTTPFLAYPGKAIFLLCQTSNPSAAEIQNVGEEALYRRIARLGQGWGDAGQIGFVVGATQPQTLAEVRGLAPDRWLLAPGVGAQGGDLAAALAAGLDSGGSGLIVPVSRAVIYAVDPRQAALDLRERIQAARQVERVDREGGAHSALITALHEAGCVKFGDFTLASGKQSPIYIDLRRIVSYPALFRQTIEAYTGPAGRLSFDCLAAVPYAALPIGVALALELKRPMVYPRKEIKAHGTGQVIEGAFEAGQTVLLIEDLVTSGGSVLTAIEKLEAADLIVRDVIVLIDRQQGGQAALAEKGYQLHAALTIGQILDTLSGQARISPEMYQAVRTYLEVRP
ncbi:MAG: orotidine-5'-phosphate decarboxylase [Thermoflexales bacterium]|nr:orotidine-5'-phosphate decarboxylase [Thermoflexales bacterium]